MSGNLFICGTPIGNLQDISFRALETLKTCDYIACEDTRRTLKLTNYFEIETSKKLISFHEHNKHINGKKIIEFLKDGKEVVYVSDAGMPLISDPGFTLVALARENNINVTTIPGPTALISGLILSGIISNNFIFDGFLPKDKKEQKIILESYADCIRTIILYESPHRIVKTLSVLAEYIMDREVAIIREITKIHEETIKGSISFLLNYFKENEPRGEMVIVIEPINIAKREEEILEKWYNIPIEEHMNIYLNEGYSKKDAMKLVAKDRHISKSDVYRHIHS